MTPGRLERCAIAKVLTTRKIKNIQLFVRTKDTFSFVPFLSVEAVGLRTDSKYSLLEFDPSSG